MKPRYTLTITDNELGKEMTIASDEYTDFKRKTLTSSSAVYEMLDKFEKEVSNK